MIYGATLEAYSFIHGLLQAGVSGEQIIFVQPPFNEVSCFNNKKVEQLVYRALEEKGILLLSLFSAVPIQLFIIFILAKSVAKHVAFLKKHDLQ